MVSGQSYLAEYLSYLAQHLPFSSENLILQIWKKLTETNLPTNSDKIENETKVDDNKLRLLNNFHKRTFELRHRKRNFVTKHFDARLWVINKHMEYRCHTPDRECNMISHKSKICFLKVKREKFSCKEFKKTTYIKAIRMASFQHKYCNQVSHEQQKYSCSANTRSL